MVAKGFAWFGEARSSVLAHVGPLGVKQSLLGPKLGVTKQAVQQFVDELVADGIVRRLPDPSDARGKIVTLTEDGVRAMTVANDVKRQIESEYRRVLGPGDFNNLMASLEKLSANRPAAGK